LHVYPLVPTTISIGFYKIDLAIASTFLGNVAENITVYLSGLTFIKILAI